MAKRFTDTTKWTNNKWFFNLSIESKLFWMYLLDACDQVGVWEENVILASRIIGYEYSMDTLLIDFGKQIHVFKDNRKWWIVDFCGFQYGELKEESTSKPILSHISLLKKHQLWESHTKGMDTLKEKVKDKEEVKVEEKEPGHKKFYKDEFEKTKGHSLQHKYYFIIKYIYNIEPNVIGDPGEHILKLKKQISFEQFIKLHSYCEKRATSIKDMVDSWLNKPSYSTGRVSVYAVLQKWASKAAMAGSNFQDPKAELAETNIGQEPKQP